MRPINDIKESNQIHFFLFFFFLFAKIDSSMSINNRSDELIMVHKEVMHQPFI